MKRKILIAGLGALLTSSCASWMQDGDDGYSGQQSYYNEEDNVVVGGQWHEKAVLSDEPVVQRSTYDRRPAEQKGSRANPSDDASDEIDESASPQYKRGNRATADDFVNGSQNEGSLWASGDQTNYYFTKNRLRSPGDIVSITLDDQLIRDLAFEVKRNLTAQEKETEIYAANNRAQTAANAASNPGGPNIKSGDPAARAPASTDSKTDETTGSTRSAKYSEIDVTPSLGVKAGDTMMAEILERYPNGNYKIRGTKRVAYRGGYRMLNFLGVAKASDLEGSDQIPAGKFYEYRIKVAR